MEDASEHLSIRQVLDRLEDVFFIFDAEGIIHEWNARLLEVTRYAEEEIASMHPVDFVPDEERNRVLRQIQTVVAERRHPL